MSGTALTIDYNDKDLQETLRAMLDRTRDFTKLMKAWGSIGRTSVIQNFEDGGRPEKWEEAKDDGKTLYRKGLAGGLAGSVNYEAARDHVILGTNKVYAAIHQFGMDEERPVKGFVRRQKSRNLRSGRSLSAHGIAIVSPHTRHIKMPARPFLVVQAEDITEMQETLKDYVLGTGGGR